MPSAARMLADALVARILGKVMPEYRQSHACGTEDAERQFLHESRRVTKQISNLT